MKIVIYELYSQKRLKWNIFIHLEICLCWLFNTEIRDFWINFSSKIPRNHRGIIFQAGILHLISHPKYRDPFSLMLYGISKDLLIPTLVIIPVKYEQVHLFCPTPVSVPGYLVKSFADCCFP